METGKNSVISYHKDVVAPCVEACPLHIDIPRYCSYIAQGKFEKALAVIRENNPLPGICGSVCFAPCESRCRLGNLDSSMKIRVLKRFVAEKDTGSWKKYLVKGAPTGKRVAIIGSGPCGLTAAYYLAKLGHQVTIFEALPHPGGMLRFGIPEYRLSLDVLDADIKVITADLGVEIKANYKISSVDEILSLGYNALLIASGCPKSKNLGVEGENLAGVIGALEFLRLVRQKANVFLGDRVAVIGGGNVAVDCARSALRAGSREVYIIYRRSLEDMPANREEVRMALEEGIHIECLVAPTRILGANGRVKSIECSRMRLGEPDETGRATPVRIEGSEFVTPVDTVVVAVGEMPDLTFLKDKKEFTIDANGTLVVDENTLETGAPGVFAGGDVVTGPASVVKAISAGRRAAKAIDVYLGGCGAIKETLAPHEAEEAKGSWVGISGRGAVPVMSVEERVCGFARVELSIPEEVALKEAGLCLRCDLPFVVDSTRCCGCFTCELLCSLRHEGVFDPLHAKLQVQCLHADSFRFMVTLKEDCDNCGICVRYCAFGALTRGERLR